MVGGCACARARVRSGRASLQPDIITHIPSRPTRLLLSWPRSCSCCCGGGGVAAVAWRPRCSSVVVVWCRCGGVRASGGRRCSGGRGPPWATGERRRRATVLLASATGCREAFRRQALSWLAKLRVLGWHSITFLFQYAIRNERHAV